VHPRRVSDDGVQVETVANGCKEEVLSRSLIMLCTIASTGRLLREWEENCSQPLNTHTVIVDECGCTTESSVALLMRMDPKNLIMVGDHKQLPPTSMVPPRELEGTGHDRSLLERCVQASGRVHRLVEQYRMHDAICRVVSTRFYNSMLQTPASVRADRQRKVGLSFSTSSLCLASSSVSVFASLPSVSLWSLSLS
jgi:superfamily I DNA and/or RNA helicase